MALPVPRCVKVSCLRPQYDNLREWLETSGNVLVTRRGRIFINGQIFHYPESIWANPYTVKEYGVETCLFYYKQHLYNLLQNPIYREEFLKLKNARELGCFCEPNQPCHRNIILEYLSYL
jgi:hypothetical protein